MRTIRVTLRPRTLSIFIVSLIAAFAVVMLNAPTATAAVCTVSWDGGAGTPSWQDADNWDSNALPVAGEDVCIEPATSMTITYAAESLTIASITANANASLAFSAGSLTVSGTASLGADVAVTGSGQFYLDGPSTIAGGLTVDGSWTTTRFGGAGDTVVTGALAFNGGNLKESAAGAGSVSVAGGVMATPELKFVRDSYELVVRTGTLTLTGGDLIYDWSGQITIDDGATLEIADDTTLRDGSGGAGLLTVNGTLTKSAGTGSSTIGPIDNRGTVRVMSGVMSLTDSGSSTAGIWNVSAGGVLEIGRGQTWDAATSMTGAGDVSFINAGPSGGSSTLDGVFGLVGHMTLTGGDTTIVNSISPASMVASAGALAITGAVDVGGDVDITGSGRVRFDGPSTIGGGLTVDGTWGTTMFGGAGDTVVAGEFTFIGGALRDSSAGAGSVSVGGGSMAGPELKFVRNGYEVIVRTGTMTWTGGEVIVDWSARFTIKEGAELDSQGDFTMRDGSGGAGRLTVEGTFRKSAGDGTTELDLPVVVGVPGQLCIEMSSVNVDNATLDGTLSSPLSGFTPGTCAIAPTLLTWTTRTGEFATLDLPALPADLVWQARYGSAALVLSSRPTAGLSFSDTAGHWSVANITTLADSCITIGFTDGTFRPEGSVTRAQMAAFLMRSLGIFTPDVPTEDPFDDVPKDAWYAGFVAELKARNISQGFGDGTYGPDDVVTRDQMAAFLMRALGEFNPPEPTADPFVDVPKDAWYAGFVKRLVDLDITQGCGDGTAFCPENTVKRGEMAAFIVRAWGL